MLHRIINILRQVTQVGRKIFFPVPNKLLTPREKEVFLFILEKYKYREISEKLHISEKTVSKHASNIFEKTGCVNRKQLERKFRYRKLISKTKLPN